MMIFPSLFGLIAGPAISGSITIGLSYALISKYRNKLNISSIIIPSIFYAIGSIIAVTYVKQLNLTFLAIAFGFFLLSLSAFYLFFSNKFTIEPKVTVGIICGFISGIFSGLFAIGGPLMALFFLSAFDDHDSYIANGQLLFALTGTITFITRIINGIYLSSYLKYTLVGFIAINIGMNIGILFSDKLNKNSLKKIVYVCVGISGILTIFKYL